MATRDVFVMTLLMSSFFFGRRGKNYTKSRTVRTGMDRTRMEIYGVLLLVYIYGNGHLWVVVHIASRYDLATLYLDFEDGTPVSGILPCHERRSHR